MEPLRSQLSEISLRLRWLFANSLSDPIILITLEFMVVAYGYSIDYQIHGNLDSTAYYIALLSCGLLLIGLVALAVKNAKSTVAYGARRCLKAKDIRATMMRFSVHMKTLRGYIRRVVGSDIPDDFILKTLGENPHYGSWLFPVEDPPRNLEHVFRAISLHMYDELVQNRTYLTSYVERVEKALADKDQIPALRNVIAELFMEVPLWYRISVITPRQRGISLYLEEHPAILQVLIPFLAIVLGAVITYLLNIWRVG